MKKMKKMTATMTGDSSERGFGTTLRMILKAFLISPRKEVAPNETDPKGVREMKKMTKQSFFGLAVTLLILMAVGCYAPPEAFANDVTVSNVRITDVNASNNSAKVKFDITWENSWWLSSTSYDAVWVFIKYSTDSGQNWKHAKLSSITGLGSGTWLRVSTSADQKGVILRREDPSGSQPQAGTVTTTGVYVWWDYGENSVQDYDTVRIKVFAIEMVHIPSESFYAGSNSGLTNEFSSTYIDYSTKYPTGQTAPSGSWPNGYYAFWLMKYEISQGQYAEFLNTLTADQKTMRYPDVDGNGNPYYGSRRYSIQKNATTPPTYTAVHPDRACTYLSWDDVRAYADWAALRPMTELEYEKACRGPNTSVTNEYAWGNSTIIAAGTISTTSPPENGREVITTPGANACFNNVTFVGGDGGLGPLRCGIFATNASNRQSSGAGYYGNMELSGNLYEYAISIGDADGRTFTGSHGSGEIDANGAADVTGWPGTSGARGGSYSSTITGGLCVSMRNQAMTGFTSFRYNNTGGRLARTGE